LVLQDWSLSATTLDLILLSMHSKLIFFRFLKVKLGTQGDAQLPTVYYICHSEACMLFQSLTNLELPKRNYLSIYILWPLHATISTWAKSVQQSDERQQYQDPRS